MCCQYVPVKGKSVVKSMKHFKCRGDCGVGGERDELVQNDRNNEVLVVEDG